MRVLACFVFFCQENQHVHLLWFKKWSFTLLLHLTWNPNPTSAIPSHFCHAHLHTCTEDTTTERAFLTLFMWSVKSDSCCTVLLSHVCSRLVPFCPYCFFLFSFGPHSVHLVPAVFWLYSRCLIFPSLVLSIYSVFSPCSCLLLNVISPFTPCVSLFDSCGLLKDCYTGASQ